MRTHVYITEMPNNRLLLKRLEHLEREGISIRHMLLLVLINMAIEIIFTGHIHTVYQFYYMHYTASGICCMINCVQLAYF